VLFTELTHHHLEAVKPEYGAFFERFPVHSLLVVPLRARGRTIGVLSAARHRPECPYSAEDENLLQELADRAALGIANARLFAESERRVRQLGALRAIDMVITSSLDVRVTLDVILDRVTAELGMDAADVLLFNAYTQQLEVSRSRGLLSRRQAQRLHVGEGFPGRAVLERRTVTVPDLGAAPSFVAARHLDGERFVSYCCAPLIAKGLVKGVLETFHRTRLDPDPDWLEFFETLAGQAAIAVDSAEMFESLNRANAELLAAYDQTLEGWVRALDLRDKETEGHTQRVTEMSVVLAQALGTTGEALVHVQRGARLHDIGKMAVPDDILLKPGALTPSEREVMCGHPNFARDMLAEVPFLRPALDIPWCHHEHWDGSGYPRQLKGEEIPNVARVFTIVDVWDALSYDRPYRRAWPRQQVLDYIRDQSGALFDPRMVEAFLDVAPYRTLNAATN
jgi:response regulator RpfG family c-di-GMP phosphodiesterase